MSSGIYRSTGGLPEPTGESMGLSGREEEAANVGVPPKPNLNWGGGRPPFPSPSLLLPSLLLLLLEGVESYSRWE